VTFKWLSKVKFLPPSSVPLEVKQLLFETFCCTFKNKVIGVGNLKWLTLYMYVKGQFSDRILNTLFLWLSMHQILFRMFFRQQKSILLQIYWNMYGLAVIRTLLFSIKTTSIFLFNDCFLYIWYLLTFFYQLCIVRRENRLITHNFFASPQICHKTK